MKKLFIGAAMAMSFVGLSQSKYFSISAGYGLGFPGNQDYEAEYEQNTAQGVSGYTYRSKNLNVGGGLNVNASYGLPLSQNLHLDLGASYQNNLGSKIEGTEPGGKTVDNYDSWSARFTPNLRFQGDCEKIVPFGQIGPQLSIASMTQTFERNSTGGSMLRETKYSTNLSVGAFAALGAEMEIADDLWLFATVSANVGYYSPTKSEIVAYEVNGVDMLDQLTVREREQEYEKEVTYLNTSVTNEDEPTKSLRRRVDYSAVSFNVGIRVVL